MGWRTHIYMIDLRLSRIGTVGTASIGMGKTTPIHGFNSHSALVFSPPPTLLFSRTDEGAGSYGRHPPQGIPDVRRHVGTTWSEERRLYGTGLLVPHIYTDSTPRGSSVTNSLERTYI